MTDYVYPQVINPGKLHQEVAAAITAPPLLLGVSLAGSLVSLSFDGDLDAAQQADLDALVAAHNPAKPADRVLIAPSTLIRQPQEVTNQYEWQALAEVVSKPDFFAPDLTTVAGQILGRMFCVGGGAEVRLVEDVGGLGQQINVLSAVFIAPDTAGGWPVFGFFTSQPPAPGINVYELQGRRNSASDFKLKGVSLGLYVIVP